MTQAGNVLLVGSSGGHLAQLWALAPWWSSRRRTWVTFDTTDATSLLADERTIWAHHPTTRSVKNFLRNLSLALRVIRAERPDLVVSTGAAVALPFFIWARIFGIATAYIEVYDRVDSATLTGRLCRPLADVMCVQWPEQRALYRDAELIGPLL